MARRRVQLVYRDAEQAFAELDGCIKFTEVGIYREDGGLWLKLECATFGRMRREAGLISR